MRRVGLVFVVLLLAEMGLARQEPRDTGGRPAELWRAVQARETATKATEATKLPVAEKHINVLVFSSQLRPGLLYCMIF